MSNSTLTPLSPSLDSVLATMHDAGSTRVPQWSALAIVLAQIQAPTMGEAIEWLHAHRDQLERAYQAGQDTKLRPAQLPAHLSYTPELGGLERAIDDHWLRGRRVFAELVDQVSFMQASVFAISGRQLAPADAQLLEQIAVTCLTVDSRAWPMAATRRSAGEGAGLAAAVLTGVAMMASPLLAGAAAAQCAEFLIEARRHHESGGSLHALVVDRLQRRQRVMGFGRPAVGADERVPVIKALATKYHRDDGPYVRVLESLEIAFVQERGLKSTAAAWAAAILCDIGLEPAAVHAVCNHWVSACVFAQATYSDAQHAGTVAAQGEG